MIKKCTAHLATDKLKQSVPNYCKNRWVFVFIFIKFIFANALTIANTILKHTLLMLQILLQLQSLDCCPGGWKLFAKPDMFRRSTVGN